MIERDTRLDALRPGMRVKDPAGMTVGYVREISGRSVLVGELVGRRVFWLNGERVGGVADGVVQLVADDR